MFTSGQFGRLCRDGPGGLSALKIMLGHDDINPRKLDIYGQTLLRRAPKSVYAGATALPQPSTSATPSTA